MSSFQRMVVIPQEEYQTLINMQNIKDPLFQHFQNLEHRYDEDETVKDPLRRLVLQSDTLNQMKQIKDQMRNSLTNYTPKPYVNRAKGLFQAIEHFLKFNDKGEIYNSDGNVISGSRLEDLIQYAVRDRRRNLTPTGWSDFLNMLREYNVPKSFLNLYTLEEMENSTSTQNNTSPERTEEALTPTARPSRSRAPLRFTPGRVAKPTLDKFKRKDFAFLKHY